MSRIPDVQQAVRELEGVAHAVIRWPEPQGPAYLRVEFASNTDERALTQQVLQTLRTVGGVDLETMEARLPDAPEPATARPQPRPVFAGMTVDRAELDTSVEVTLSWKGQEATGRSEGLANYQTTPRTAAAATLIAVREYLPPSVRVQLEWLEVFESTQDRPAVVQVAVTCLTRAGEETFVGSVFVRGDVREAAVRATLDALNRRMTQLLTRVV